MPYYIKQITFIFILFFSSALSGSDDYDLLILNGNVLDGTGNPWTQTDIAVIDNRIVAMGNLSQKTANRVIDASGLFVTPGFIDSHSHAAGGLSTENLSAARPQLTQGITTVIVNPDGNGATDLIKQQNELTEHGLGVHVAQLVPHGAIRREIIGMDNRPPTSEELEKMKELTEAGMQAGAVGLSTGLFYTPANYAETDEIIELARIAARYNGVHQSHIRDESDYTIGVVQAVQEIIDISEASGVVGIVSHIKALGPNVWGKSEEIVELIDEARDEKGMELYADQYPYEASATSLMAALVPGWAAEGGRSNFLERLNSDEIRIEIIADMEKNLSRRGGAGRIVMRHVSFNSELEGVSLQEIADSENKSPIESALELLQEGNPGIVSFNMHPDDVEHFMKQPWTMTASDGGYVPKDVGVPHPRNYGAFPRKLVQYSIEQNVIDLPSAIRGMTSLPATVYRLPDRGLIRPGMIADIAIFDKNRLNDNATFTDPHQLSDGMIHVLVGGKFAIENGELTGMLNGRVLQRNGNLKSK